MSYSVTRFFKRIANRDPDTLADLLVGVVCVVGVLLVIRNGTKKNKQDYLIDDFDYLFMLCI